MCSKHGLNNVTIDYTEENFRQWTSYKLYADQVRPMVLKENPKVSMTRLVQLIAAKWREFDSQNPFRDHSGHSATKKPKEGGILQICTEWPFVSDGQSLNSIFPCLKTLKGLLELELTLKVVER